MDPHSVNTGSNPVGATRSIRLNMSNHILHILIGIPGCGKSTFAKGLAEKTGATIVSSDAIREELTGSENAQNVNREVFELVRSRVQRNILDGDVIVDATNTQPRDWNNYIGLCPEGTRHFAYWFDVPPAIAKERQKGRERQVPGDVIDKFWDRMCLNRKYLGQYFRDDEIFCIS